MSRRVAQALTDQGRRVFEQSEFAAHPVQAEQRSVPGAPAEGRRIRLAFLCLLSLAKQRKWVRCRAQSRPTHS